MIFEIQYLRRNEDGRPEIIARSLSESATDVDALLARVRAMAGRAGWPRNAQGARILERGRTLEEWWRE
jgi:hypothetical protein